MSKHVLLARHAEAASTSPGTSDRERALTEYGVQQAATFGRRIASGELPTPQLALTSDAVRARQTWREAARAAGVTVEHRTVSALYDGTVDALVEALAGLSDDVSAVVLVGHAPDVPALASRLQDARPDPAPLWGWAPGTVGVVEWEGDWADFPTAARLLAVVANDPA